MDTEFKMNDLDELLIKLSDHHNQRMQQFYAVTNGMFLGQLKRYCEKHKITEREFFQRMLNKEQGAQGSDTTMPDMGSGADNQNNTHPK